LLNEVDILAFSFLLQLCECLPLLFFEVLFDQV